MLGEAFEYPRRGEDWLARIGIGGILVMVGALILIPMIVVEGYVYRVLRGTTHEDRQPPDWEDWIDLFVEGIQMYLIQLVYLVLPFVLLLSGALIAVFEVVAGENLAGIGFVLLGIGGLLQLLVMYLLPAALSNFAYNGELGAAFDFGTIRRVAVSGDYFVAVVLSIVVGVVIGLIGSILSLVLVGIFILFYLQVAVAYLWGRGFVAGGGLTHQR